ncbi:dynein light chain 1, cytoplasmic [Microbotryum lychnidis-dioicae p1A1 Lamole]|uniref:Dynein light chain n=2 Tax=Microbotryum TaxID=34416 RepID=U5HAL5_USTV1|nr:dynein light chain 1, cytoplasmic [Microbotryum lychnidis-dioicae p1A1 Lamole]SGZ21040.1 BQ5605_C021g09325 [Microbotryum silenes-dioicae]|eukprot:KDE05322.1 dynein light chain 1, cytoplasmic [Microbotryum lychnidis-dioicae p1A1 Lamole]
MADEKSTPTQATIKSADMADEMQKVAIQTAIDALEKHEIEKDIAAYIKRDFDKRYGPTWHVVVGKSFGSFCTHESGHFVYFYLGSIAILLFKAG